MTADRKEALAHTASIVERLRWCRWRDRETGAYTTNYELAGIEAERLEAADKIDRLNAYLANEGAGWNDAIEAAIKAAQEQRSSEAPIRAPLTNAAYDEACRDIAAALASIRRPDPLTVIGALREAVEFAKHELETRDGDAEFIAHAQAVIANGRAALASPSPVSDRAAGVREYTRSLPEATLSAPEGWRGIESAPKDSSEFLAWDPIAEARIVVRWVEDEKDFCLAWNWQRMTDLTKWQPLPAPPKESTP